MAQAEALLRLVGKRDVTPEIAQSEDVGAEGKQASEIYKKKRPKLNFKDMGIEPGSVLDFTEDSKQVTVINDKRVSYEGSETSLTAITAQLLDRGYLVQPSPFWRHEGRLLRDIYEETYSRVD